MKQVDSKYYSRKYYLTDCSGHKEFKAGKLDNRLNILINNIPIKKGCRLLDVGCGRGEITLWAVKKGAAKSIGIDYSTNALSIANKILKKEKKSVKSRCSYLLMDAKKLDFHDDTFDTVIFTEIAEHLYPDELDSALGEINRVLKKNGKLILHTEPNKLFNDIFYRFWCYPVSSILVFLNKFVFGANYPNIPPWKKLRSKSHKIMHINEPTYFSLSKLLNKHKFYGNLISINSSWTKTDLSWKDKLYNKLVYLEPVNRYFPFNILFGQDFFAVLTKKYENSLLL